MRGCCDNMLSCRTREVVHDLASFEDFRQHGARRTLATIHNIPYLQIHNLPNTTGCFNQRVSIDAPPTRPPRATELELALQRPRPRRAHL